MRKGFTLIELLIVIGIIAILSVVVILTLNPAQLLRQSRDSSRISDMSTLKSALALYLADVSSPSLATSSVTCFSHNTSTSGFYSQTCSASGRYSGTYTTTGTINSIAVDSTGWIPVNFTAISSGSPIPAIAIDPVNNRTYFYAYAADGTNLTYELNAKMESTKFSANGGSDVETTDGGNSSTLYEAGSDPGLNL